MATDATFDNQLQALATATSNFANGKDVQIKNTIITALGGSTQSGGGGTTGTIVVDMSNTTSSKGLEITDIEGGKRFTFGVGAAVSGYIDVTIG